MAIDMVMDLRPVADTQPAQLALKFDYDQIAPGHRERVMRAATVIHEAGETARKSIIQIGRELNEVKKRLGYRQFGEWLRTEFDMSERTAQNMMNVARRYNEESAIISFLSDTVLYMLAAPSTPEEARAEIEQAAAEGQKITVEFAKEAVRKAKPEPVHYMPIWNLGRVINAWLQAQRPNSDHGMILDTIAGGKPGYSFDKLIAYLETNNVAYRKSDLVQAINNVRDQRRQAKLQAGAKTVYTGEKPEASESVAETLPEDNGSESEETETVAEPKPAPIYEPPVPDDPILDEPTAEELAARQEVAEELAGEDDERDEREAARKAKADAAWADARQMQREAEAIFAPTSPTEDRLTEAQTGRALLSKTYAWLRAHYGKLTGKYTDLPPWERSTENMVERLDSLIEILSEKGGA